MVAAPPGLRLRFPPSTTASGSFLIGGDPVVVLRLTPAASGAVAGWRAGAPVGDAFGALARRLLDDGLADPDPDPAPGPAAGSPVAVVIPALNAAHSLGALLASLPAVDELVVVDDGSTDATAEVAGASGARVISHRTARGPAAARNAGLAATTAPLVFFVDADARVDEGALARLAAHFADPMVAAVAPRVLADDLPSSGRERGAIAVYEAVRSPLDLGERPGPVSPGRRLSYLPSAALLLRREALVGAGGFDEELHFGEDVDLSWRLASAGWSLRYEPGAVARHRHRTNHAALARRRFGYGSAAGRLGRRHPADVAALTLSAGPAWIIATLAGRGVRAAAAAAGRSVSVGTARLSGAGLRPDVAARLVARDHARQAGALLFAVSRPWLPLTVTSALVSRRARAILVGALAVRHLRDWRRLRPAMGAPTWIALRTIDDAAFAAGAWWGAATARSVAPLAVRLRPPPASEAGDGWVVVARFG